MPNLHSPSVSYSPFPAPCVHLTEVAGLTITKDCPLYSFSFLMCTYTCVLIWIALYNSFEIFRYVASSVASSASQSCKYN